MRFKVLIVEDEEPVGDMLETAIKQRLEKLDHEPKVCRCKSIPESRNYLEDFRPHVVTLDLKEAATDDAAAGKPAWDFIRDVHFCPVVFYSANALPEGFPSGSDPFAQYLNKNEKQADDVAAIVEEFIPHVVGLEEIRLDVESRYAKSLQKTTRLIWATETEDIAKNQAFLRISRRRLAAVLEHPLDNEHTIKAWEQFLYPPTDESTLCTGDIVMRRGADKNIASSFFVILTPPCDLVPNQNPIDQVLLARCRDVSDSEVKRRIIGNPANQENAALTSRQVKTLSEKLAKDEIAGLKLIPKLSDLWPTMVLDFKALELVSRSSVALSSETLNDEIQFERIASMDSPFRESLAWRFIQTAGRPGTPDSDRQALETEVRTALGVI